MCSVGVCCVVVDSVNCYGLKVGKRLCHVVLDEAFAWFGNLLLVYHWLVFVARVIMHNRKLLKEQF